LPGNKEFLSSFIKLENIMKGLQRLLIVAYVVLGIIQTSVASDFTGGSLFVVNQPSSGSAGYDFILEFSPDGTNLNTLIPTSQHILGMRDVAFSAVTGTLFYTVSNWSSQTFEIREIDSAGNLIQIYTHSDFGSGNIELVFDLSGTLFIANNGFIFKKEPLSLTITKMFALPYTGIGDLEIDSHGNLYLSDPFVNSVVHKITPTGSVTIFADADDGMVNPYGLAMDAQDNLYVANCIPSAPATIIMLDPEGDPTLFAEGISFQPNMLDLAFDRNGTLLASCREKDTILRFSSDGSWTTFADDEDGINDPASMAFITYMPPCEGDFDGDGDVDGSDLAVFAADFGRTDCDGDCEGDFDNDGDVDGSDLAIFALDFGRTDCGSGQPCEGDFDHDGDVDGSDLAVFAADFGRTDCPH
jgi:hypothetical protein